MSIDLLWLSEFPADPSQEVQERYGKGPKNILAPIRSTGVSIWDASDQQKFSSIEFSTRTKQRIAFASSVSKNNYLLLLQASRIMPLVIYYQVPKLRFLSFTRRLAFNLVLERASAILVLNEEMRQDLLINYPNKFISVLPWFVDDCFFFAREASTQAKIEPFLFAPGDRGRLDQKILELADKIDLKIVRVSRFFDQSFEQLYLNHPNIEVRHFVKWDKLLEYYQKCELVLNMVDDSATCAGMTSLVEALLTGAKVVTSDGNSSSDLLNRMPALRAFSTGWNSSADEWASLIAESLKGEALLHSRQITQEHHGLSAVSNVWLGVINHVL